MISLFDSKLTNFYGNFKINSLKEFTQDKSVIVHMTDYFPVNGEILSTKNATKDKNGISKLRNSIHFAFNQAVPNNLLGFHWDKKPIGIISPFNEILKINPPNNILGGQPQDFFIKERVKLPEGSVIVRYSPNIPKGKLKITNSDSIDFIKKIKGIKLVETSENVKDITNKFIEEMGYTRLDKLFMQEAKIDNKFTEMDFERLNKTNELKKYQLNSKDIENLQIANNHLENAWSNIAKNVGFNIYKNHQTSPYGRSEFLVDSVNMLAKHQNKWIEDINTFNIFTQKDEKIKINYKDYFINVIENINTHLKNNEELSYNINKFKDNIKISKTPQEALDKLAKEQKIKPMDEDISNITSSTNELKVYETINNLIDLFSITNKVIYQ